MNAHTVGRHVKLQPRANSSQTSRRSLVLSLPTNFSHRSSLHRFRKPPASAGGASESSTLKASP